MKKIVFIFVNLFLISCATTSNKNSSSALYEVLIQEKDGGAPIRFFEILSEESEIKMLLTDDNLKNKIKASDLKTCNFVILNIGEKPSDGYTISISKIEETDKNIIIYTQENIPQKQMPVIDVMPYPFMIVKVNSKKELIFK